jgi:integrase/recombinase XerD
MKTASKNPRVLPYSRHAAGCKYVKDETRLTCDCPKWLRWHRDGKPVRKTADTRDGDSAMRQALELMAGFEAAAAGIPMAEKITGRLLEEAITTFLDTKAKDSVTDKHVAKYRFELSEFSTFMAERGLVNLGDITAEQVLSWRNALDGAQSTNRKKVHRLKGFFTFCVDMGMIVRNPAAGTHLRFKETEKQAPKAMSDEQFEKVLACVQRLNGRSTDEERRKFRSLVILMRWSGLAIRDALFCERAQFQSTGDGFWTLFLRRAKTGAAVSGSLLNSIMDQVLEGANPEGRYLFVDAVPEGEAERDAVAKKWGTMFSKLSDMAQLTDEHGEPFSFGSHAMRHTFVRACYDMGMSSDDIASLIGDSVAVLLSSYSGWVESRQQHLTERFQNALASRSPLATPPPFC